MQRIIASIGPVARRFPVSRYAASHFGKTLLWVTTEVYAVYSLTELMGLTPLAAGIAFLLLLVWSALCDLVVGRWLDRVSGGTLPTHVMRWCAALSAVAFAFSFVPFGPDSHHFIIAMGAAILFRLLFAMADVPHNGLLRELGTNDAAWVRLAMVRLYAGAAAGVALSAAGMVILAGDGDADQFRIFTFVIAVFGAALFLLAPSLEGHKIKIEARPAITARAATGASAMVFSVIAATMFGIVGFSLVLKLLPYVAKFVFFDLAWAGQAMLAVTIGKLSTTPFWYWLQQRIGSTQGNVLAYGMMVLSLGMMGVTLNNEPLLYLALGIFGAAMGGASMLSWALIAQCVDSVERQLGGRVQSLLFGLFTCASKLAVGLGGTVLAVCIGWIGSDALSNVGFLILCAIAGAMGLAGGAILALAARRPQPGWRPDWPASTT